LLRVDLAVRLNGGTSPFLALKNQRVRASSMSAPTTTTLGRPRDEGASVC